MTLHSRLHETITARLELARRAEGGGYYLAYDHDGVREFFNVNDPSFIIQVCERDLSVLGRHRRFPNVISRNVCAACSPRSYPCVEIRDLATVWSVPIEEEK